MGILDGRVVIVTGAANGIGRATAIECSMEGANVVAADVDVAGGAVTVKMIEDEGGTAMFVPTDVTDRAQVAELVDTTIQRFGKLDGAFNNAGIEGEQGPIDTCASHNWDRVIDVNLSGVFHCMQAEVPAMLEQGNGEPHGGSIVNCASVAGLVGFVNIPAYVASKHGVVGLTKAAALDLADKNIRVNALCPGVIETDMVTRFIHDSPETESAMEALAPMNRMGTPSEMATFVTWLLSDKSSYVTGQALAADGGLVAR
jgi:NAD(P)-dependent dehydrogenase (short-subunit alcohol dehydrogenase family)